MWSSGNQYGQKDNKRRDKDEIGYSIYLGVFGVEFFVRLFCFSKENKLFLNFWCGDLRPVYSMQSSRKRPEQSIYPALVVVLQQSSKIPFSKYRN